MSKTLARATLALSTTWVQVTAVHAVVIPSDECKFAYGDTQPASTIDGSIAYNSLSLLGVNSPPVVVAGTTVVSITSSGLFSKSIEQTRDLCSDYQERQTHLAQHTVV
jgi:hypothetical protein